MRITPDPFGSPSTKRTTPSSSATSLNTLANGIAPSHTSAFSFPFVFAN